jgi:hypothetical protein
MPLPKGFKHSDETKAKIKVTAAKKRAEEKMLSNAIEAMSNAVEMPLSAIPGEKPKKRGYTKRAKKLVLPSSVTLDISGPVWTVTLPLPLFVKLTSK